LVPAQVWAGAPVCANIFSDASPGYLKQVVQSRGLRLFIKTSEASSQTQWYGVIRHVPRSELDSSFKITNGMRYLIKTLPLKVLPVASKAQDGGRVELTPMKALYDQTVKRGSNYLSKKFFNKNLEPALFTRLPFLFIFSMYIWDKIDQYYSDQLAENMDGIIKKNESLYENLINYDYRYRSIKKGLLSGKISRQQALETAFWMEFGYAQYFSFRDSNPDILETPETQAKLIKHFAFNHLDKMFNEGVKPAQGFFVPEENVGPISEQQKALLFKVNHVLNLQYQLITEFAHNSEVYKSMQNDSDAQRVLNPVIQTEFSQKLLELKNQGIISVDEYSNRLQEDAYWQTRFAEWQIIGVTKLKLDSEGQQTQKPLTLEDIRLESLSDL
jgi:hypothetical protein